MSEQTESNWTQSRFRQRLVGASVVVALAVLLLPLWLDGSGIDSLRVQSVPEKPEVKGVERIEIPQPPSDSGEPLDNPPQSLFPDQTPIEARSDEDDEAMRQAVEERASPAPAGEAATGQGSSTEEEKLAGAEEGATELQGTGSEEKSDEKISDESGAEASLPKSSASGEFIVQLGSFSDERNAKALAESVESSGFDVFVTPLFSEQGTVWRVRVGPYANREQANEATERLRQRINRDGLVMTK
ncbi:MAG TPA: SPOR domain-containing protein [Guyparkeria sp.]|nr:SPOR domain-containing protein [Guyparkeria sp.]